MIGFPCLIVRMPAYFTHLKEFSLQDMLETKMWTLFLLVEGTFDDTLEKVIHLANV